MGRLDLDALGVNPDARELALWRLRGAGRAAAYEHGIETLADAERESARFSPALLRNLEVLLRALPRDIMLRDSASWDVVARRAAERLTGRRRVLVSHWVGIDIEPRTFRDIGRTLGVSSERVRQISRHTFQAWRLGWETWVNARLVALVGHGDAPLVELGKSDAFFAVTESQTLSLVRSIHALDGPFGARSIRRTWHAFVHPRR